MSAIQRVRGAVGVALLMILALPAIAQDFGKWTKAAEFPEPEEELYGIAAGGKMYVMGGYGEGGKPVGMVWEYDPASDHWTKKKTMPVPVHHQAMAEYQGKIYVFGGFKLYPVPNGLGGWEPVTDSWEYDPATDNWKPLPPMPTRRGSAIAQTVNGKIYVIGGSTMHPGSKEPAVWPNRPARSVGTNEMYDPATNKWTERQSMPTARNHAFSGMVNGKIYVIGGRIGSPWIIVSSNTDIVEEYDPATDQWGKIMTPMPTPRSGGGCATYNGKIYVAGGELQTRAMLAAFRALEAYDPATNTWEKLPAMPYPRHGVAAAFFGNHLHLVSGKIVSGGAPDVQLSTKSHDVYTVPEEQSAR